MIFGRRESDATWIDQRDLGAVLEEQHKIGILRIRVNFLFERSYITPSERQTFSRRHIEQSRALIIVERSLFVTLAPMTHR